MLAGPRLALAIAPRFALASFACVAAFAVGPACDRPGRVDPKPVDLAPPPPQPTLPAATSTPSAEPAAATSVQDASAPVACERDPKFPAAFDLAEASAAAEVELTPGARELLVVADSGHKGESVLWNITTGAVRKTTLPLDANASDDLEGIAWMRDGTGGHLFTLTSSGAVRRFSPDGKGGLKRDGDAYPLGAPPASCDRLIDANCGRNYEGLCLRAPRPKGAPPARCAGYAASKRESKLYCLVFQGDRLVADPIKPPTALALKKKALSDCAFGAEGGPARDTLVVTTNLYDGNTSYVVDEASGALSALDVPGTLNNEGIAIDHVGALYQMMDTNGDVSAGFRHVCRGW